MPGIDTINKLKKEDKRIQWIAYVGKLILFLWFCA